MRRWSSRRDRLADRRPAAFAHVSVRCRQRSFHQLAWGDLCRDLRGDADDPHPPSGQVQERVSPGQHRAHDAETLQPALGFGVGEGLCRIDVLGAAGLDPDAGARQQICWRPCSRLAERRRLSRRSGPSGRPRPFPWRAARPTGWGSRAARRPTAVPRGRSNAATPHAPA